MALQTQSNKGHHNFDNLVIEQSCEFFPGIPLDDFHDKYNLPNNIGVETVKEAIKHAITVVNFRLKGLKNGCNPSKSCNQCDDCSSNKFNFIAEVKDNVLDGENEAVFLYKRAVYCYAKGLILKETQTLTQRKEANNLAKHSEDTEDKYNEWCDEAINRLYGKGDIDSFLL